jgi:membrane protein YqaA with SNARE-associated domain
LDALSSTTLQCAFRFRRVELLVEPTLGPAADALAPASAGRGPFGLIRRLYDWTLHWADTKWGPAALAILAFAESSVFPIPPDPLLMALSLGKPRKSFRFAAICTAASVLGGVLGYAIGYYLWHMVDQFFFSYVPGFSHQNFLYVQGKYKENAFLAIFSAALTPIPYKVFTIASGVFETGLTVLITASILGRGMRFFGVAALMGWLGDRARQFIDRYFNLLTVIFTVVLVLGFIAAKYLIK